MACQLSVLTQYQPVSFSIPSCAWSKEQAAVLQAVFCLNSFRRGNIKPRGHQQMPVSATERFPAVNFRTHCTCTHSVLLPAYGWKSGASLINIGNGSSVNPPSILSHSGPYCQHLEYTQGQYSIWPSSGKQLSRYFGASKYFKTKYVNIKSHSTSADSILTIQAAIFITSHWE